MDNENSLHSYENMQNIINYYDLNYDFFAQQGWQCPICKRIYSPTTYMCWYCSNDKQTTVTSTGTDAYPEYIPPINKCGKTEILK